MMEQHPTLSDVRLTRQLKLGASVASGGGPPP